MCYFESDERTETDRRASVCRIRYLSAGKEKSKPVMERSSNIYQNYVRILERELVPAMGCTEPVAIAYCAAKARAVLGTLPASLQVKASGNIIKNVKSVVVPNTGGRRGIEAAAAAGALYGDADAGLEVISHVTEEQVAGLKDYLEQTPVQVLPADSDCVLDIKIEAAAGDDRAVVRVANEHTNIVLEKKNGQTLLEKEVREEADPDAPDYSLLSIEDIIDFAQTCDLEDVKPVLDRQITMNTAICEEGLKNSYGANIGKVLMKAYGDDVRLRAKAVAAAGSDARMNGCELPVVINSGSGNQGITASIPVLVYAKELGADQEKTYRALLISNLVTLHEKEGIGRLSAYCGAVSAGAGAGPVSPTCTEAASGRSPIRWSMPWPSLPELCAMARNPPAQRRSPQRWMRAFWDSRCSARDSSSTAATGWWPRVWKTPCATSAVWERSACGRRTRRSSRS